MKIGFIGAGKVGMTFGKLFAEGGIPLSGYYSKTRTHAEAAAAFTGSRAYDSIKPLLNDSDALFLTVPDGEIAGVYGELKGLGLHEKALLHCSGVHTAADTFPDLPAGSYGFSAHPLYSISDPHSYAELKGATLCLEGSAEKLPEWESIFTSLGFSVQVIAEEQKPRYHAAAVMASNLLCGILSESISLLQECGFSEASARAAVTPLTKGTVEHLLHDGAVAALTGPVERGDVDTVRLHLQHLPEDARELYRTASLSLLPIAKEKHPDRDYKSLEELLKGEAL